MTLKQYILDQITKIIVSDYDEGLITDEEAEMFSNIVLERYPKIKTEYDILALLSTLNAKYDAFENLEMSLKGAIERKKELQAAQQVLHLIKHGAAKKAVQLAKQHTE